MAIIRITTVVEYDTETGSILTNSQNCETIKDVKPKQKAPEKAQIEPITGEPKVTLESNKLVFTTQACELLGVNPGDELVIQYADVDNDYRIIIGNADKFGIKGNKLTKSLTVSYRGKQFEMLKTYGDSFIVEKQEDNCVLVPLEPKFDEITNDALVEETTTENLEMPEETINFDFDFNNI
jgi:hypothetical protein